MQRGECLKGKDDWQLNKPVAFFLFNRPETTRQVFAAIREARPPILLVVADGPRLCVVGEEQLCVQARSIIDGVDWDCRLLTNYSEQNLGCMRRVSSGLNWVFQQVEEAIILEDDCLPDPSFFRYCQVLLDRFKDEPRIAQISGVNFQFGRLRSPYSYYFSRYNHIWGWASWRRAWEMNDNGMDCWHDFRDSGRLAGILSCSEEVGYWTTVLDRVHAGEIDTWDCRWTLSCWRHNLLTVIPAINLVSNIGFGPGATHTPVPNRYANMQAEVVQFPLCHPPGIQVDLDADTYTGRTMFREPSIIRRLLSALRGDF